MTSDKKIIVVVGIAVLGLLGYFLLRKKSNYELVKHNLGDNINDKDGIITVAFNDGKNQAQFYKNDRVIIFDNAKNIVARGNYSDGGKTISIDGGKQVSGGSVWNNLLTVLKK